MAASLVYCLPFLIFTIVVSKDWVCKKQLNGTLKNNFVQVSGTYDLCDFVIGTDTKDGWYAAYDNRTVGNTENGDVVNYTFYFNIAANIRKPTPDPLCDNFNTTFRQTHGLQVGYCKHIVSAGLHNATCNNIVPITQMTSAYQVKKGTSNKDKCWRLHDGLSEPIWTYLSDSDPALGIELRYTNGDWCAGYGKNREFKMQFKCTNDIQITPDYVTTVFEPIDVGCSYEYQMSTYRGCPTECVVDNDQLCNGHGVCDYDWSKGAPKCFCYMGWFGKDCNDVIDTSIEVISEDYNDEAYIGALVVVILLLLVILSMLGYLFLRYTRIKNQPFDFKFLQATKRKIAKRSGVDE